MADSRTAYKFNLLSRNRISITSIWEEKIFLQMLSDSVSLDEACRVLRHKSAPECKIIMSPYIGKMYVLVLFLAQFSPASAPWPGLVCKISPKPFQLNLSNFQEYFFYST